MRISLCSTYLWRHVEWCADIGTGEVVGGYDLGEAEVAELDTVIVAQKDYTLSVRVVLAGEV